MKKTIGIVLVCVFLGGMTIGPIWSAFRAVFVYGGIPGGWIFDIIIEEAKQTSALAIGISLTVWVPALLFLRLPKRVSGFVAASYGAALGLCAAYVLLGGMESFGIELMWDTAAIIGATAATSALSAQLALGQFTSRVLKAG